jgi:hypothetical protein
MDDQNSRLLIAGAMFVSLVFAVSASEASKRGAMPEKQYQPDAEWIILVGDLESVGNNEVVEGCCPHNGPFPEYKMTLDFPDYLRLDGTYDGHLFADYHGAGRDQKYKVQFWNEGFGIEVVGGVIDHDEEKKILMVTFTDEDCVDIDTKAFIAEVNFTLIRTPYYVLP